MDKQDIEEPSTSGPMPEIVIDRTPVEEERRPLLRHS